MAAVEPCDVGQIELATAFHRLEQFAEIAHCAVRRTGGPPQELREQPVGQKAHALGEEAEHELVYEVGDLLRRATALKS